MTLRVASWNVESIRAHHDQILDWTVRHEIDVLAMQETKAGVRKFPRGEFEDHGYELVMHGGDNGRGGVAFASRQPMLDITLGIPGAVAPLDEPRSIAATIGDLRIHTVYAPNGRKVATRPHEIKLAWFALLAAWLDIDQVEFSDQLLIGDLNIAPTDLDVWDASRYRRRNLTSAPERKAFDRLLAEGARLDLVRERLGDERVFTWWNRRSDFYESNRGWRLDHAIATPAVAERVRGIAIDRVERGHPGGTDHAPIVVVIDEASTGRSAVGQLPDEERAPTG